MNDVNFPYIFPYLSPVQFLLPQLLPLFFPDDTTLGDQSMSVEDMKFLADDSIMPARVCPVLCYTVVFFFLMCIVETWTFSEEIME